MFCPFAGKQKLTVMVHLTYRGIAKYCFILLCFITLISCGTKHVCMAVSNNGKPDYYNEKQNRDIQNAEKESIQTTTTGLRPSQIDELNPDMKKFRKKKEKTKAKRPRHKKNQPIF
jgi:hypothetical protein